MDREEPRLGKVKAERRRFRRVKIVVEVQCAALDRREIMMTRDIGVGGLFIKAKFPIPLESELSLIFLLSPLEPAITCRGRVMYSRMGQGMGIQFLDLSEKALQSINKFVNEVG